MMSQYEVNHMENRMLVDSEWPDTDDFSDEEEFEEDDIDEF